MPVVLRAPWGSALGGNGVCSGEDEEGEEGCQQRVCPQPCPVAAGWLGAGCLNGASVRRLRPRCAAGLPKSCLHKGTSVCPGS